VVKGVKTPNERFAGAEDTYCIEALMQDGKALQAGTSHFLGQNFAKAFDVQFANKEGVREYVWGTSWGVSTRLMGALEMGLIARGISVKVDARDTERPGFKFAEWEMKGVPVRLAIGARDLDNGTVEVARRDTKAKMSLPLADIVASVDQLLIDIQHDMHEKAKQFRATHTTRVDSYDEFKRVLDNEAGFVLAHYDGTSETEERIKDETKATVRCLALNEPDEDGTCMVTGKPSTRRAYFARAY